MEQMSHGTPVGPEAGREQVPVSRVQLQKAPTKAQPHIERAASHFTSSVGEQPCLVGHTAQSSVSSGALDTSVQRKPPLECAFHMHFGAL
eukprot:CAMPEP_0197710736 /NCGR_PEP_ID=MMETSP1338-20131121/129104_1 /TAXON_ID=43686 ORGANISM="Pelagodinium beii, Strain RCC1491" /NCGR_SAMPLE_ID=MMETSP1338 /ASSEMBLY_ACC=CAM_ASM_000754 /LENGTH=89 /DNA_ID=CAMNT_0043294669 /DNA_START=464 /DNA_END=733 /DNA_ORIENTATION=+